MVWYKNSMQLDMRRGYIINRDNKRHYLTVLKGGERRTCKSRGQIQLKGTYLMRHICL